MRLPWSWCIAFLAALLSVLAPVLAYAVTAPAQEHAHHAGMHNAPSAPHCPYCPDFAAGAALGTTVPVVPAVQPAPEPLPASPAVRVGARPSLRLAPPRGPPADA